MKIRHKITAWVAGAGLMTSLVFSFVVFWEMQEQPFEIIDSQIEGTADAIAKQLAGVRPLWRGEPVYIP